MPRLAVFLTPGRSLEEAVERVRLAESLGYESAWVTQIASREPLQVLGRYAAATTRIGLGTGVVPIFLRHPALMALEAATLDEISGGRLRLGLGVSHPVTVEGWYGLELDDPVGRMREYLTIVRQILETGGMGFEGTHYTARFGLAGGPRPGVPLLMAALGPRMLRLAAEIADGIVLWFCSPRYIRDVVRPTIDEILGAHGRDPDGFDVVAAVPLGLSENPGGARDQFRRSALAYVQLPFYRRVIEAAGHGDVLAAFDERVASADTDAALAALPDAFCDEYAAVGDAKAMASKLDEYRAAGVTVPAVGPIRDHEGSAGVEATLETAVG